MELALFIYLAETICRDETGSPWILLFVLLLVFSFIGWVLRKVGLEDSNDRDNAALGKFLLNAPLGKIIIACMLGLLWNSVLPTQKTAYTMLGAYGIQTFANSVYENEQAKRIAVNSLNLVEKAISKYEKELSK